mgnify:FL=1
MSIEMVLAIAAFVGLFMAWTIVPSLLKKKKNQKIDFSR